MVIGFLRFLGLLNAGVWLGAGIFFTFFAGAVPFSYEMRKLLGETNYPYFSGAIAQLLIAKYFQLQLLCGVVAFVHLATEWLYLGKTPRKLSFAVLVGEHLSDVWNRWSPSTGTSQWKLPPAAAFVGAALFLGAAVPYFSCVRIDPSFISFPARATALMKAADIRGNVATFFDWGEYLIWHLGPGVRVSIDGRRETVYSPVVYNRSLQFLYGVGEWDAILEDPRTDMALVGRDQPTYNLMRLKPGWILVYEDSLSALFTRPDSPQALAIRNAVPGSLPPDGNDLCFP